MIENQPTGTQCNRSEPVSDTQNERTQGDIQVLFSDEESEESEKDMTCIPDTQPEDTGANTTPCHSCHPCHVPETILEQINTLTHSLTTTKEEVKTLQTQLAALTQLKSNQDNSAPKVRSSEPQQSQNCSSERDANCISCLILRSHHYHTMVIITQQLSMPTST